jgi:hypothetical protein
MRSSAKRILEYSRDELAQFVNEFAASLSEDEALAVLASHNVSAQLIGKIAQTPRLIAFYNLRVRLVSHRQTPQAHAVKLVHYLYWFDLLDISLDVQVPAPVRRAVETQLVNRAEKLSLGEKVSSARRCTTALIKVFMFDPHPKVFESLLVNNRLREDDLLHLVGSNRATPEQLRMIAEDPKWSYRQTIRRALVLNPHTPRAAAASQLRYLSRFDLRRIHSNPSTSVYLRRCIERLSPNDFLPSPESFDYNTDPDA